MVDAQPTSPTTATVVVTPPAGGPWARFNVLVCPEAGPTSKCVNTTCFTPTNCPVSGLDPDTPYIATVGMLLRGEAGGVRVGDRSLEVLHVRTHQLCNKTEEVTDSPNNMQVVATKSNGQISSPSMPDTFTTPSNAPILTSAEAWGPTAGQATATPPPGVTYANVSPQLKKTGSLTHIAYMEGATSLRALHLPSANVNVCIAYACVPAACCSTHSQPRLLVEALLWLSPAPILTCGSSGCSQPLRQVLGQCIPCRRHGSLRESKLKRVWRRLPPALAT